MKTATKATDVLSELKMLAKEYSGDRKTQVAAGVYLNGSLKFGVNHLPYDLPETDIANRTQLFYDTIMHAEVDMANKVGHTLKGATVYVTLFPCDKCAARLIAEGVKHIIVAEDRPTASYIIKAKELLDYAHVTYEVINTTK